jgi:simple sugar transport system permease protein
VSARVVPSALALLIAFLVSALVIALAGANPAVALRALAAGAFGSVDGWSEVGVRTCPLLLTGLGVAIAFRAAIWNIGAEGQLLVGAGAVAWLGTHTGALRAWLATPIVLAAAAIGGAVWAAIAGVLKAARGVDEVIGTIVLNFIAIGLLGYAVHGPLMEAAANYPQTDAVALAARLPRLVIGYRVHAGLLIALATAAFTQLLLFRTVLGFSMRAAGLNPIAARLAGLRVTRALLGALTISGALAGLAGGIEVSAVRFRVYDEFSPGYGFTAIAVALLGRFVSSRGGFSRRCSSPAASIGSAAMQRTAGVSSVLVSGLGATVIFSLIAVEAQTCQAAAHGGRLKGRHTRAV